MQDRFNEIRIVPWYGAADCVYCDGERSSRIGSWKEIGVLLVYTHSPTIGPHNHDYDSYDDFVQKLQEESDLTHHFLSTQLLPKDDP